MARIKGNMDKVTYTKGNVVVRFVPHGQCKGRWHQIAYRKAGRKVETIIGERTIEAQHLDLAVSELVATGYVKHVH